MSEFVAGGSWLARKWAGKAAGRKALLRAASQHLEWLADGGEQLEQRVSCRGLSADDLTAIAFFMAGGLNNQEEEK